MTVELTLLRPGLPLWLRSRVVDIAPGADLAYDAEFWRDAVAVLERGTLVLRGVTGVQLRLDRGAVAFLSGLQLASLRNTGDDIATLAVAWRRSGGQLSWIYHPDHDLTAQMSAADRLTIR